MLLTSITTIFTFLIVPLLALAEPDISSPGDWSTVPLSSRIEANNQQPWLNTRDLESVEALGVDPLSQHVPPRYNKHPETVPVLRTAKGTCECSEAPCPAQRLTSQNAEACRRTHALACWRRNPACEKPVIDMNSGAKKAAQWKVT